MTTAANQVVHRVILVDDQALVRSGLASLLSIADNIDVVYQAADGQQALNWMLSHPEHADIVLLDLRMPVLDGIETLKAMGQHDITTPVLILTTFDDHALLMDALKAGAKGYLLKDVELETLLSAIARIVDGETLVQPAITERLLSGIDASSLTEATPISTEPLSKKEMEVLRLVASGLSNKEIAEGLFKSEGTIKNQISAIIAKLGVRDRTQAVLKAIELGYIGR